MGKSLSQLEATQAVAVALQRQITDLEQQRDAALKLAQSWLNALYLLPPDSPGKPYTGTAYRKCAKELRAIFSQKEEK